MNIAYGSFPQASSLVVPAPITDIPTDSDVVKAEIMVDAIKAQRSRCPDTVTDSNLRDALIFRSKVLCESCFTRILMIPLWFIAMGIIIY